MAATVFLKEYMKKIILLLLLTISPIRAIQIVDIYPTEDLSAISITHLVADFLHCKDMSHPNPAYLEQVLRGAALKASATPLEFSFHQFEPDGFSAVLILGESHISVHYWYKEKYADIDCVTCGKCDPMAALAYLKDRFEPKLVFYNFVQRPSCKEDK